MPGKVKVKIVAGRNLPVMDRSSDTTDAYVEIKLGNTTFKTDVCRKSLNPQWNSEWYRFEMDDAELQDEPLQIRLMDHDTYSANDAIGKVYLDLNPLLLPPQGTAVKTAFSDSVTSTNSLSGGNTMSGWFPVYDTMHGIRGEVNVIVKVELFSDFNKFRQSSCGVQFFNSSTIPHGYHANIVHGMVEELVVSDDPEYQWIDKIRTPRASNEARQTQFFKLSGEVQRKIGLKVLDFGGNAVIGYLQCFDLEAECGIVVRGLGTAVSLVRSQEPIHSLPCQYSEELNYNHYSTNLRNPILNVVSASPLHKSPSEPKQLKGYLRPGSPRNRRSKSPQVKQPFSEYKPKRLGTYSRSVSDNAPEYDNVSLKALFEQEDMRGEPVSNRKKIFERLSSFPKRKFRALRTNSGGSVSRKAPFVRSKSENVASVLIRSIMDPNAFLLARVPETDEISDSNKSFDSESIVHPLRYDDGHLVPISSSSSDISSSDIEDISDDISSNSTSTQDYSLLESDKGKHSKLNTSTSVDNSITSRNEDDLAERINTSTSFDNSITSKVDEGLVEKEEDSLSILKPNVFTTSVHVVITGDSDVEDNIQTQYSSFVKFKDSPSPPIKVRSIIGNLKRQESFDATFGIRKRSDTPPLSEMDPYVKFMPVEELNYSIGTLHKAKSAANLMVTQPSLDEDLKSRPVTNLSFPESVRNLPSVRTSHIPSCSYKTVHTVDFSGRNDSVRLLMGSAPSLCPDVNKPDLNGTDSTLFKITAEKNELNHIPLNELNKEQISFIPEHKIKEGEVILKTENNPFEFPSKISSNKIKLIDKLSEYFETKLTTYQDNTVSTTQSTNESTLNKITSQQGEDLKKEETSDCFNSPLQNQTTDNNKATSSESELSINEVSNCEDITVIENCIEVKIHTVVEDFETIKLLKDKKDIVEEKSENSKNSKSDVGKNVDSDFIKDNIFAYKLEINQNANGDSAPSESRDCLLSTENNSLHQTPKEFSEIVTVKEYSPSKYIEPVSVPGVKDKEKIEDSDHDNKITGDEPLSVESEEIDKITSNADDDKSLFIFGQKSSLVEELQELSEKDTVNEAVVPELTEEHVTCAVSTSLDDNAPRVETPVDNDSTNQVCDTVTSNLSIPHLPLVKSLSASGLVEPCHSSVPPSRTVPEESAAGLPPATATKVSQSPVKLSTTPGIHRRSSDSDLSITPKGNSLTSSGDRSSVAGSGRAFQSICPKLALKKEPIEPMEFPFLTMNKFPPGFVVSIASTVVATSVKLSERISNLEEPESRDAWWMELRKEIRNHMRALSCNAVIGYSENSTICDDVCVLSATGTAAIVNVRPLLNPPTSDTPEPPPSATIPQPATKQLSNMASSLDRTEFEASPLKPDSGGGKSRLPSDSAEQPESASPGCSLLHLPFKHASLPFPITTIKCGICKKQQVPDLMLATIEPPDGMSVVGRSGLVHAFVLRQKQHVRGEMNACTVSDHLPFVQFDVYKQLVNKLRVNGMNAVFGLKIQICLGEKVMAAVASGTGMCLEALPLPPTPNIKHGGYESKDYTAVMKALQENVKRNREFYQVNQTKATGTALEVEKNTGGEASDTEDSDNEKPDLDLNAGNKDVGLIVVDDEQDIEEVNQLLDSHPPEGFFVTATESLPGLDDLEVVRNLQMFTQILRMRNNSSSNQPPPPIHYDFDKILQGVYYKMRRMTPCALGNFKIRFALPESDDIQICIVGMALGLNDKVRKSVRRRTVGASSKPESGKKSDDGDLIFSLEEDQESSIAQTSKSVKPRSPARVKRQSTHMPPTDRYGVDITPLSYIPGGRIERYLGNLNFFFVRETSCIRESGGPSGFVHSFVAEVLAILRAHVTALGGNALAAFFLNECVILSNPQKNHGQCLINVGGDVVLVSYIV